MADKKDVKGLIDAAIEGGPAAKQAVLDVVKSYGDLNKVMSEVSEQTRTLFALMDDKSWVEGWAKALELQEAAAETMGELETSADRMRWHREKELERLQAISGELIAEKRTLIKQLTLKQKTLANAVELGKSTAQKGDLTKEIEELERKILSNAQKTTPEYIKALKAKERSLTATNKLADKTEGMLGTLTGIGSQWKDTFLGSMVESAAAAEGLGGKISAIGKGMSEGFAKALSPMNLFMSTMQKVIEMTILMVTKIEEVTIGFRRTQGVGEDWESSIIRVRNENYKYSLSYEESAAALGAVRENMASLSATGREAVTSMANFIAPLSRLGLAGPTAAKAMETMIKGMKKSKPEAEAMTHRMISLAQAMGKPPEIMVQEFNAAMPILAAYGDEAEKVFRGMQVEAAATGVEMGKLISVAETFDTFESAAGQVGTLNAVLGGAYFNSMQMMNASHEERIKLLREGFSATGKSFDQLSYYEKKAVAAAMGLSDVNEAQKMLGTSAEDYAEQQKKVAKAAENEAKLTKENTKLMRQNTTIMNKFAVAMEQFGELAKPVLDVLRLLMKVLMPFMKGVGILLGYVEKLSKSWYTWVTVLTLIVAWMTASAMVQSVLTGVSMTMVFWNKLVAASMWLVNAAGKHWKLILMVLVPLVLGLVDSMTKEQNSPPLYIALFIVAAGIFAIGRASDTIGPKILMVGAGLLMMGGGIALAALGLSTLADSMANLSAGQMIGFLAVLLILIVGFTAMVYILAPLGPIVLLVAAAFLVFGAGIALAGLGAMLFAKGIEIVVNAFISLIGALLPAIPQIALLAISIALLAVGMALAAISAPFFAIGLVAIALGFAALAITLAFIKTSDLEALGQIFMGLGLATSKGAVEMGKLPKAIRSIIKELEDMDLDKIDKLAASIDNLADASERMAAIKTLGLTAIGPAPGASATAARVNTGAAQADSVKIATQAAVAARASTEVTREVVEIIKEKLTYTPAAATTTPALPEGVLVTRDVVVDLGREFDYRLKRKVETIVEKKLEGLGK